MDEWVAHYQRINELAGLGRHAEAIVAIRAAFDDGIHDEGLYHLLASLTDTVHGPEEGAKMARWGLQEWPESYGLKIALTISVWRSDRLDEALALVEEAVALGPREPGAHNVASSLWLAKGDPQRALRWADQALELAPNHSGALKSRAQALEALGRSDEALELYKERVREGRSPDSFAWTDLGWALLNRGDHEGALGPFRLALSLDPTSELAQLGHRHALWSQSPWNRWLKWPPGGAPPPPNRGTRQAGAILLAWMVVGAALALAFVPFDSFWLPFVWALVLLPVLFVLAMVGVLCAITFRVARAPEGRQELRPGQLEGARSTTAILVGLAAVPLVYATVGGRFAFVPLGLLMVGSVCVNLFLRRRGPQ